MSVKFENGAVLQADYVGSGAMIENLPVSVQLWLYVPEGVLPTVGAFWPIWTLGERDAQNYVALEAALDQGDPTRFTLTAAFDGGTRVTASVDDLQTGAWHLATVVLVNVGETGNAELRLYVDDNAVVKQTGAKGSLTPMDWDLFLLGQTLEQSGTVENPTFHAEQPAIWDAALADGTPNTSDAGKMYAEKIPPAQAGDRLNSGTEAPDFGYWYITAHSRSGLRVNNAQVGTGGTGDLFNEADPDGNYPPLQIVLQGSPDPRWSARTPILRYTSDQAITPIPRPPFREPSRLQPAFFMFNDNLLVGDQAAVRDLAQYHDPNITRFAQADYLDGDILRPPYLTGDADRFPRKELSLVAKTCADWFELQGFTAGNGVGPGKNYAGCLYVRGVGHGGLARNGRLLGYDGDDFRGIPGAADTIPLEMNVGDWVYEAANHYSLQPWQTWYRATGAELVGEYMDHFWLALKQELDDRGLCYPLRLHMDYERWPRAEQQLRRGPVPTGGFLSFQPAGGTVEIGQVGAWPATADDTTRAANEVLARVYNNSGVEVDQTLDDLSPPSFSLASGFYGQDAAFIDWWWGWSYTLKMEAVAESIARTVKDVFPYSQWSNYWTFSCSDPDYPFIEKEGRAYTTPRDAVHAADFSAPVIYNEPNWVDRVRGWYDGRIGYTISESVRDMPKMRIDACANSGQKLKLAPWFENPLRYFQFGVDDPRGEDEEAIEYIITVEDQREIFEHAWRQGCDEYILFCWEPTITRLQAYTGVCQWLRDTVHGAAQTRQDHAARTGRLARRSM